MIVRPVDIPKLRAELITWLDSQTAANLWAKSISMGNLDWWYETKPDVNEAQSVLRGYEITRLGEADLYFVGSDMVELAKAAARSIPDFALAPEDMPSPTGLMVFEEAPCPIVLNDIPVGIKAVCWSLYPTGEPIIWGTIYLDRTEAAPVVQKSVRYRRLDQEPNLFYAHGAEFAWRISRNQGHKPPHEAYLTELAPILRSAWLLMQQPVAAVSDAEYKRHDRRRLERQKIEPRPVRVITLRRAKTEVASSESEREYHHQWIVRGHWRQQWYPSRGVHRPVWIAPHIKGPEGAPLLGGEKVHAWVR